MKLRHIQLSISRRNAIASGCAGTIFLMTGAAQGQVLSGIDALDTPAIQIEAPGGVFLLAVVLVETRLIAVGEHGVILYSDDGGNSWRQARVPVNVTLTCVGFASRLVGWAAGHFGVILNTIDGGKSWRLQLNGIEANDLTMAAAQASTEQNDPSPAAPLALRRANVFMESGPSKPFLSLLVLDSKRVLVVGAYRMAFLSDDGGKTWADWSLRIYDKLSHNLYAARRFGSNIFVVGESGLVFRSTDDAATFPQIASPSPVTLFGILQGDQGAIITYGVAGNCYRTIDNGQTWLPINFGTGDNLTAGIKLASGGLLIGSETGSLFISKDNGLTFAAVSGGLQTAIFDFIQFNDNELIIVGSTGPVRISTASLNI